MTEESIRIDHLKKTYGDLQAVDDLSFSVDRGEIFGFLGPNGAGKTTTVSILATLLPPDSGTASVGGWDILTRPDQVRRLIGIVFQDSSLDIKLTVRENLDFHARIYRVPDRRLRVTEMLDFVELTERADQLVETLSGGMRRRLEIARALTHRPAVLFLDEPTIGLDVQNRRHIWQYLQRTSREDGMTVFLTTHNLTEAEDCDRVGIIDNGRLVACDTPASLKASLGGCIIRIRTPEPETITRFVMAATGLEARLEKGQVQVVVDRPGDLLPILMREQGTLITDLRVEEPQLEDVFLDLTGHALRDEQGDGQGAWHAAHAASARREAR